MAEPLQQADIYNVVFDFVITFIAPEVQPKHCLRGWQNRTHLPEIVNDFIIMTILNSTRVGTNKSCYNFDPSTIDDGSTVYAELVKTAIQIDFFAETEIAQQRAQKFELLMRSPVAVDFFQKEGIAALYADDVRDLTGVDGSNQFVQRFSVTLHLSCWVHLAVPVPWFDNVNLVLKNPDVLFETE